MLEKKVLFEYKNRALLENQDVYNIFSRLVDENKLCSSNEEVFVKVGTLFEPVSFNFNVAEIYGSTGDSSKIHKINDEDFMVQALRTAKKHRVIDDIVYRKNRIQDARISRAGEYVIVYDGKPVFAVSIEPSVYAFNTMIFRQYGNKEEFFKHAPGFETKPQQSIELELCVQNEEPQDIFTQMYARISKHYIDKGIKIIESLPAELKPV